MARMPPLSVDALSEDQRRVYDAIAAGPRGVVRGPLAVWLQSHGLAARAQELGAYCRYGSSLPPGLSELAIVVTAAYWRSGYEWSVHAPIALRSGVSEAALEAIRSRQAPVFDDPQQGVVHAFATELLNSRRVCDATWERAHALLGMQALVDLVGVLGYYGLISMTINAFEIPADGDDPFADAAQA